MGKDYYRDPPDLYTYCEMNNLFEEDLCIGKECKDCDNRECDFWYDIERSEDE